MKMLAAACVLTCALPCAAQPLLKNAQVTNRDVTGGLAATVRSLVEQSTGPAWIAWETPSVPRRGGDNWCWSEGTVIRSNRLEPGDTLYLFVRVENRRIDRLRMFDDGCPIDAGNRPVTWLRGVAPAESISLAANLAGIAEGAATDRSRGDQLVAPGAERQVSKGAMAALAQHAGPEASRPLLRLARQAPDAKSRGEALFWLAQRAGREAAAVITDAIENDPETEVKKKAVFALSQLPPDEGVPKLIEVARSHRNPAVRKQAMFWLGQSKDARALAFFEEVLK